VQENNQRLPIVTSITLQATYRPACYDETINALEIGSKELICTLGMRARKKAVINNGF
jgi:hypothetical protein